MSINYHVLTASKDVKPYSAKLVSVGKSAVASLKKFLPIKNIDIVFYKNPGATFNEGTLGGIGGFTPNAHTIFISLNPQHANFISALQNELFFTLVHELHHTVRWQKTVDSDTLLEAMVFEGLADHFAMKITRRRKPSVYSSALKLGQKRAFLRKAKREWNRPSYNHSLWFYGSKPTKIPRWTGYTLGYDLVSAYVGAHPKILPSELAFADASLFIV